MDNTNRALTEEEAKFAERHHDLLIAFLRRRRLPESEYYDVVILRYIRTVQLYCSTPRLRQYSFKTILNKALEWTIKGHWQKRFQESTRVTSLDAEDSNGNTHYNMAPGYASAEWTACDQMSAKDLLAALSESQRSLISLRLAGYSDSAIGRMLQLSVSDMTALLDGAKAALDAMD